MKYSVLLLCALSTVYSNSAHSKGCNDGSKAKSDWKLACSNRLVAEKIMSGAEYKGDPCKCGLELFTDIKSLADNKCKITPEYLAAIFANEKFVSECLERK